MTVSTGRHQALLSLLLVFAVESMHPGIAIPAKPKPSPKPSPKRVVAGSPIDRELDRAIYHFEDGEIPEGFIAIEQFLQTGERAPDQRADEHRARMVLSRWKEMVKLVPEPLTSYDGELAGLLYFCSQAFERAGNLKDAQETYHRLIKEYPKAFWQNEEARGVIAAAAKARLDWLAQKHPWIRTDPQALTKELLTALKSHQKQALSALIARSGFWFGSFVKEGKAEEPDKVLKFLEETWPAQPPETSAEPEKFSDPHSQVFLKTAGWKGRTPEVYFVLERVTGGWQWSGLATAPSSKAAPPGPVPASPLPSPTASPSPAAPKKP